MLCGGQNVEFLRCVYDSHFYKIGVILTDDGLCKKQWLGINYPKKILVIEDLRILFKILIHLVFKRHILQVLYVRGLAIKLNCVS